VLQIVLEEIVGMMDAVGHVVFVPLGITNVSADSVHVSQHVLEEIVVIMDAVLVIVVTAQLVTSVPVSEPASVLQIV